MTPSLLISWLHILCRGVNGKHGRLSYKMVLLSLKLGTNYTDQYLHEATRFCSLLIDKGICRKLIQKAVEYLDPAKANGKLVNLQEPEFCVMLITFEKCGPKLYPAAISINSAVWRSYFPKMLLRAIWTPNAHELFMQTKFFESILIPTENTWNYLKLHQSVVSTRFCKYWSFT